MITVKNVTISSKTLIYILIGTLLILIAGLRPIGIDGDSLNYVSVLDVSLSQANFIDKEPTFWIINELNRFLFFGKEQTFFLIFAIIGVGIKLHIIRRYSVSPILSLLTYASMFFIIQEMTQIRAGVAIGFVFWALHDLVKKRNTSFITKILIATLFHYSAIVMFMLYFLSKNKINSFFYFLLPLVGLFLSCTNVIIEIMYQLVLILPDFLSTKIHVYLSLMEQDKIKQVNPVNIGNFFLLCIYYLNLYIATTKQKFEVKEGYYLLCIKLLGFGFFILFSFSFLEVFAYRMANYLFFGMVFLLPIIVQYFRQKKLLIVLIGIYLIYTLAKNSMAMLNL